jgi:hypothetical protein
MTILLCYTCKSVDIEIELSILNYSHVSTCRMFSSHVSHLNYSHVNFGTWPYILSILSCFILLELTFGHRSLPSIFVFVAVMDLYHAAMEFFTLWICNIFLSTIVAMFELFLWTIVIAIAMNYIWTITMNYDICIYICSYCIWNAWIEEK